jgi:cytoskeletal protein CcmA (bactofilin family)
MFKSIKESIMASNAHGKEPGRRESSFDMSSKNEPSAEVRPEPRQAPAPQLPSGPSMESPAAAHGLSVIGPSLVFKGELTAEEDLLIQGRVEGSIHHSATNLTIGANGDVKADIVARKVIIQGAVQGDVRASDAVTVEASARVQGNLFAPLVALKDGAKFKGAIDMGVAAADAAPRAGRGHGGSQGRTNVDAHPAGGEIHGGKVNELLGSAAP